MLASIAYGPATLTIEIASTAADPGEWETVEETVIDAVAELLVVDLDGRGAGEFAPIAAGRYRVRGLARGRDVDFDGTTTEPVEQYLVYLTPRRAGGHSRRAPQTDHAHTAAAKDLPEADTANFGYCCAGNSCVAVRRGRPNTATISAPATSPFCPGSYGRTGSTPWPTTPQRRYPELFVGVVLNRIRMDRLLGESLTLWPDALCLASEFWESIVG